VACIVSLFATVFGCFRHFLGLLVLSYITVGLSCVIFCSIASGASGTLRLAAGSWWPVLSGVGCGSVIVSALSLYVLLCRIVVICLRVSVSVLLSDANGLPILGCWMACRMSVVALAIILAADAVGIFSFSGNQVSVSMILSHFVSVIHVW